MKKKVIIIIAVVCVAIIAVVGTIFGVNAYNNYTIQQQTEQQIKSIDDTYSKFTKETDRAKKLVILSNFIKNKPSTSDEIKVEVLNSVEPKYNETLAKMQKFFTDDYDKTIKDNTIDSKTLEKTNDKKKLQSCIDNLEALKKTIDSEKSNVFYKKDIGNYDKKPDELIATVYKGNIIKNLIMDCQSYTKYRPNETTGGIFVSWRRKEALPTGA